MRTVGYDELSSDRLEFIVDQWEMGLTSIAVVGDFFLDRYLIIDPTLTEPSIETGLDAYQVVEKRPQPGAAGTVTGNLMGLGLCDVSAIGVCGDDGEGHELRRALERQVLNMNLFVTVPQIMTPTYTKPLIREADGTLLELNRLDIRNREPLPDSFQEMMAERLDYVAGISDAVIVCDQEAEPERGVVTSGFAEVLAESAARNADCVVWVDSRGDISRFRNCIIKPNAWEACRAADVAHSGEPTVWNAVEAGEKLLEQTASRAVVITLGEEGVLVMAPESEPVHVPGIPVRGEIDIVGAGDSFTAGMVSALAVGDARWDEAAIIGNLVASITIQQIGTTGTATPEQLMRRLEDVQAGRMPGAS
ncbi:MAG: bifunctional heptose 7-phosphate kinase/heptose 1-phosphate adenyltransferase [Armatimonadota bacterium]|jgi:rfaE bifunctional protein kinase chain/domain